MIKPVDSGGQRGVFRLESLDDLEERFDATIALSHRGEIIVEQFVDGVEMNAMAVVRDGDVMQLTLSDRLRPPGEGFAVGWIHAYPADARRGERPPTPSSSSSAPCSALGLRNGIAFPQLIAATDGSIQVIEVAARIPGGQMADLVQHAVGVDLVEVALRFALGEDVTDELAAPKMRQPVAIRFFTAEPGPAAGGKVKAPASLDKVLAAPGVVQAASYIVPGETIRPVQRRRRPPRLRDRDRLDTGPEALERAEAAARLVEVEVE